MTAIFIIDKIRILNGFTNADSKSASSNLIRFSNKSIPSHTRRYGENTMPIDGNKMPPIIDIKTKTKSKIRLLLLLLLLLVIVLIYLRNVNVIVSLLMGVSCLDIGASSYYQTSYSNSIEYGDRERFSSITMLEKHSLCQDND